MEEIRDFIKLTIPAHDAKPLPSIFIPLYNLGINVVEFCNYFNEITKDENGLLNIGVILYNDLTYDILSEENVLKIEQIKKIDYMNISQSEYDLLKKVEHQLK